MPKAKLVRDLVPARLAAEGKGYPVRRIVDNDAFKRHLRAKLLEEVHELVVALQADHPHETQPAAIAEEMADVTEVMMALAAAHGVPFERVAAARADKFARSGGFDSRYLVTFP